MFVFWSGSSRELEVLSDVYLEFNEASKMAPFDKIVNSFKPLNIFPKKTPSEIFN